MSRVETRASQPVIPEQVWADPVQRKILKFNCDARLENEWGLVLWVVI